MATDHAKKNKAVKKAETKRDAQLAKKALEKASAKKGDKLSEVEFAALAEKAKKLLEGGC